MLNDATCFKNVYIVTGYTDLRSGIDTLASIVESKLGKNPFVPDSLYLFCGRRTDRIKGLVWESLSAAFCYPHTFTWTPLKLGSIGNYVEKVCG
ncbi:MAG: IS66 family insertion sequence element accessory protein TnpB [Velocimicrobium sp.]